MATVEAMDEEGAEHESAPVCVKCGSQMRLLRTQSNEAVGRTYERRTFRCRDCGHEQTYTMGLRRSPRFARRRR